MVNWDKSSEDELLRFRELDYHTAVLISGRQRKLGHLNIWKRKIYLLRRRKKTEKEKKNYSQNIWRRNIFLSKEKRSRKGKGRKYLEKENIFFRTKRKTEKGKEENIWRRKKIMEEKEKEENN